MAESYLQCFSDEENQTKSGSSKVEDDFRPRWKDGGKLQPFSIPCPWKVSLSPL